MQGIFIEGITDRPAIDETDRRLKFFAAERAVVEQQQSLYRRPAHELEMQLMKRPLPTRKVYELLGLMIGTVPPAVIFGRVFGYGLTSDNWIARDYGIGLFFLLLMMNVVCGLVGFAVGRGLAKAAFIAERSSWSQTIIILTLLGLAWGLTTGAAGGIFFFGLGAFAGPIFAIPVGVVSFLIFGTLHRALERGGMIDARHFWPISVGLTAAISMLIAGIH